MRSKNGPHPLKGRPGNRPRHGLALFHRGPKHPIRQAYRETTEAFPEKAQNWGTNGLTQFVISSPNH